MANMACLALVIALIPLTWGSPGRRAAMEEGMGHAPTWEGLQEPCSVLCLGSDGGTHFEDGALVSTMCHITTMDCTASVQPKRDKHQFIRKCVSSDTQDTSNSGTDVVTWKQALQHAGISSVDVLKMGSGYTRGHESELFKALALLGPLPRYVIIHVSPVTAPLQVDGLIWQSPAIEAPSLELWEGLGYKVTFQEHSIMTNNTFIVLRRKLRRHRAAMHAAHMSGRLVAPVPALAAHYQCFNRTRAVREVLRRFRLFYPDAPLFMVNDGGNRAVHAVATEYHAKYTYLDAQGSDGRTMNLGTVDAAIAYVQRIIDSAAYSDWVILLEDDVHLLQPISLHNLKYDMNGDNPNTLLPDRVVAVVEQIRGHVLLDSHFGGCGGTILRGSFMRMLAAQGKWEDHLRAIGTGYEGHKLPSDAILGALFYANNGTIGPYAGFVETWQPEYAARLRRGDVEVIHQEKTFYDRK